MKIKIYSLLALFTGVSVMTSCDTDVEHIDIEEIQKPYTYDEQYFQNLRDYKKTDHEICYIYFEGWNGTSPVSMGERFKGLPDSVDIVNVWTDVPTADKYPVAAEDVRYCQETLGTRFVMHADASNYNHQFTAGGVEYDMDGNSDVSDEMMEAYALYIRESVEAGNLNGVDIDYEGWSSDNLTRLVTILSEYYGPKGKNPEMLLIVDFFSTSPSTELEDLVDYFVAQDYSPQTGGLRAWSQYTPEKVIHCETFGSSNKDNAESTILEYAAWEPGNGHSKGGAGAYSVQYNYTSASGIPYNALRQAIQIMNPAIHK